MRSSVTYTVFSVVNLIAFAIVAACLPPQVSVHFGAGLVDRLGSPWQFLALPAVSALLSVALFVIDMRMKRGRSAVFAATVLCGALFGCLGWMFFGIAAQGAAFGARVYFPYASVTALPLSLMLTALGYLLPAAEPIGPLGIFAPASRDGDRGGWGKVARFGRIVLMAAGTLSAVVSIVLSCNFKAQYDYVAIAVFVVLAAAAAVGVHLYGRTK